MINKITKLFTAAALLVLFSAPLAHAASTSSGAGGEACQAISQLDPGKGTDCSTSGPTPNKLVRIAVNLLTLVAGVIAVIMFIVGGFKYVTSQGDANSTASARKTLIYAIVGLVIVVFAQVIVKFALNRSSEATSCSSGQVFDTKAKKCVTAN